jgi:hypothetical protein
MKLEGRIAGPWTAELSRVWVETAPRLVNRKLVLDLRSVTYADAVATQLLCEIYLRTNADLLAESVWTQSLAEQIMRGHAQSLHQER